MESESKTAQEDAGRARIELQHGRQWAKGYTSSQETP
jgi:hypothetical protein